MGDLTRPWAIDAGLARDLSEALGWRADDGVGALAARFPERVPMGSTAKLAAIAAGDVPPGEDPGPLARQLLEHCLAVSAGPAGGAPSPSWSCWVACTVMAGLVDAEGLGPVRVASTQRSDAGAPIVDFHAEVVVAADGGEWICDPYFGVAVSLPLEAGASGSATWPTGVTSAERSADGGWSFDISLDVWDDLVLRFRRHGPALDAGDVRALALISTTHSGVPLRPYARLHRGDGIVDASESAEGAGVLHRWIRQDGRSEQVVGSWPEAAEVFAAWTGTRII